MGVVPGPLVADLRYRLAIDEAVETGTFHGDSTELLAAIFPHVTTIELSEQLYRAAAARFAGNVAVRVIHGESGSVLRRRVDGERARLYYLDAHFCEGDGVAGEEIDCAIIEELDALAGGHPDDCIIVDDVRVFENLPPHRRRDRWPQVTELTERLRTLRPGHEIAVVSDQLIAVPARARRELDLWARTVATGRRPLRAQLLRLRPERLRAGLSRRYS